MEYYELVQVVEIMFNINYKGKNKKYKIMVHRKIIAVELQSSLQIKCLTHKPNIYIY